MWYNIKWHKMSYNTIQNDTTQYAMIKQLTEETSERLKYFYPCFIGVGETNLRYNRFQCAVKSGWEENLKLINRERNVNRGWKKEVERERERERELERERERKRVREREREREREKESEIDG